MKQKRWLPKALILTAGLSLWISGPIQAFGGSNIYRKGESQEESQGYTAADGNQIEEERLRDKVIEYDELGSLIHAGNSSVQEYARSREKSQEEYEEIREALRTAQGDAEWERDKAEEEGDTETYIEQVSNRAIYQSAIRSYNEMIDNLDSYTANKSRMTLEKQLTNSAQNLMISYQALINEQEYTEKMAELYRLQYENAQTSLSAGLGTEQDVMGAYTGLLQAETSLESLKENLASVYERLCLILGMEDDGSAVVAQVPPADLSRLETLDPLQDEKLAVSNHSEIAAARDVSSGGTTSGGAKKLRTISELENQVAISFKGVYQDVVNAVTAYEAALAGYQSAEMIWKNAQSQYALGMISQAEYLQEQINYLQKEAALNTADLSLFQALETYDWAKAGILVLDTD